MPPSNGTVIIPPANATVSGNETGGTETVISPPGNETTTTTPNGTGPIQCQPGTHEENGQCIDDVGFPPNNNNTSEGNITSGNITG